MQSAMPEQVNQDYFAAMESIPSSTYYWLAAASVVGSAVLFFTGRRNWALFVGQWPPTLLAVALLYKLLRPSHESRML